MNKELNILLLGKGARESAIAWKILQSPRCRSLHISSGQLEGTVTANLNPLDFAKVRNYVLENGIDMIMIGPEVPLVAGITDALEDCVKVIGPSAAAARLEGSKEFCKEFLFDNAIPTARFMPVTMETLEEGFSFLDSMTPPYVLKADGLAAGKGVLIIDSLEEAKTSLRQMLNGMFGEASETVVIEEFLNGKECSVFVALDGDDYKILPVARDYKRWGVGDTGLNTGGMGAISPVDYATPEFMQKVQERIIIPTIRGLKNASLDYKGFLFLGLINVNGDPMVIEYNVRLGDPETSVVMARLESDFVEILEGIADRTLALKRIVESDKAVASVVVCAPGYPANPHTGDEIIGLAEGPLGAMHAESIKESLVFPAGISFKEDKVYTSGGRVAAAIGTGDTLAQAIDKALETADAIEFNGRYFRNDIGLTNN